MYKFGKNFDKVNLTLLGGDGPRPPCPGPGPPDQPQPHQESPGIPDRPRPDHFTI